MVLVGVLTAATFLDGQEPKRMAITFDDLPFGYPRTLTIREQRQAVDRVLQTLEQHRVTATMFVIGRAVTDANRGLIDAVADAGHLIGNHSFSHPGRDHADGEVTANVRPRHSSA